MYRRCGCRDENTGRLLRARCQDLRSPSHGSWYFSWPDPAEALRPVAGSSDPAERIAYATEFLFRHMLAYQGAVRAMISATITRPELAHAGPACVWA